MKESMISMRRFKIVRRFSGIRALFTMVALPMVLTIVSTNTAYGQDAPYEARAEKQQVQYPNEELELLRSKMLAVLDAVQEFSSIFVTNYAGDVEQLATVRRHLEQLTSKDLNALRASIDPSTLSDLRQARARLNQFKPAFEAARRQSSKSSNAASNLSSDADVCVMPIGSDPLAHSLRMEADEIYFQARKLDIALNRGCNQVDVDGLILGGFGRVSGGNHSNDCIESDKILLAAEKARDSFNSCNVDNTGKAVNTAVEKLDTLGSALATAEQAIKNSVDTAKTGIDTKATENLTTLIQNALANKESVTNSITSSTTSLTDSLTAKTDTLRLAVGASTMTIATAVDDGTSTLLNNDNTNKNAIVANDNANRVLLLADAKANRDFLQVDARTNRDFL